MGDGVSAVQFVCADKPRHGRGAADIVAPAADQERGNWLDGPGRGAVRLADSPDLGDEWDERGGN